MFGVTAFINYTITVAVWTRFCFHVFLILSTLKTKEQRPTEAAYLSPIVNSNT